MNNSFNFEDILSGVFSSDTHEYEVIKDSHDIISSNMPTVSSEMKTDMLLLDKYRTELATLYYLLNKRISEVKKTYRKEYDEQYVRLVKLGRPSSAAIEAELRKTIPDYVIASDKIESLSYLKDLVSSYLRCIDNRKQSIIELFRDSKRID